MKDDPGERDYLRGSPPPHRPMDRGVMAPGMEALRAAGLKKEEESRQLLERGEWGHGGLPRALRWSQNLHLQSAQLQRWVEGGDSPPHEPMGSRLLWVGRLPHGPMDPGETPVRGVNMDRMSAALPPQGKTGWPAWCHEQSGRRKASASNPQRLLSHR